MIPIISLVLSRNFLCEKKIKNRYGWAQKYLANTFLGKSHCKFSATVYMVSDISLQYISFSNRFYTFSTWQVNYVYSSVTRLAHLTFELAISCISFANSVMLRSQLHIQSYVNEISRRIHDDTNPMSWRQSWRWQQWVWGSASTIHFTIRIFRSQ